MNSVSNTFKALCKETVHPKLYQDLWIAFMELLLESIPLIDCRNSRKCTGKGLWRVRQSALDIYCTSCWLVIAKAIFYLFTSQTT
ncbi:hypothetical protein GYMLUDRAFT_579910 [Collybiopsis luxurians FD-317 M1]|uniref:Uncharacterized protein n=1 Tax=Collybiopsis luxurians FD-317 M1 TaxID=944289 RepID=A0A0D0CFF4_9AGAR|nr:hypothetical protein GYMLUDRAFT_579910 [Collybiopsis luxurians FD-317 M1]